MASGSSSQEQTKMYDLALSVIGDCLTVFRCFVSARNQKISRGWEGCVLEVRPGILF